jgi:hypothetical protein
MTKTKTGSKGRKNQATSDEEVEESEGGIVDGKQASGGRKNRKKNK